jgi:Arylsulfotransferase (ASST)
MTLKNDGRSRLTRALALAALFLGIGAFCLTGTHSHAQPPKDESKEKAKQPAVKLGLNLNDAMKTCQGYTLLAPANSTTTYLIDMEGRVVKTWQSDCKPGHSAYLLENGNLLRAGAVINPPFPVFGGAGGRIQEFTWDGELLWDFTYADDSHLGHHDICRLPNGNVLLLVWEQKTREEAVAAGRRTETVNKTGIVADSVVEIKPTGKTTGKIVWEWHAWDHIVQEFDKTKDHFDDVGAHPERIDVNFGENTIGAMVAKPEELKKLQALGYVGNADRKAGPISPDWLHLNAAAYNAELDQIMVSVHQFSEFWVIDHSTTTAEAATDKGGKSGKGGGLLYRWGNPRAYRGGTVKDQKLFSQHNAHWIPKGNPGAGNILVFNNGMRRTGGAYSSVDELVPPVDSDGKYEYTAGKPYGPDAPVWSYSAPKRIDFYSSFISGTNRLPNGNTFICSGANGTLFEVTAEKEMVWKYLNPVLGIPSPDSSFVPKLGQMVPNRFHSRLELIPEQRKALNALDKEMAGLLDKILTDEQKKLAARNESGSGTAPDEPGQIVPASMRTRLKLTDAQQKQVDELQKDAKDKLDKVLDEKQRTQLVGMKDTKDKGPPRPPGPPGGGFGPPGGGGIFRATRYPADYVGLKNRELKPGKTIEEMVKPKEK